MERNNNRMPEFVEERDPTPLGGNVVSLGKMIVYYRIGSERQLNKDKQFFSVYMNVKLVRLYECMIVRMHSCIRQVNSTKQTGQVRWEAD